jgi:hypothetical protein
LLEAAGVVLTFFWTKTHSFLKPFLRLNLRSAVSSSWS